MSALLLLILILVIAAAGGFLGTLLEVAGWLLVIMVLIGAAIGFAAWRWIESLRSRS